MMHESEMHQQSWFVTLTYRDEEIPQYGSLCPRDFKRFVANLRKDYKGGTISYYGCGEYGGQTERPHYHAVLFGPDFLDRVSCDDIGRPNVWRSETLDSYWGRGIAEIGTLTMGSAVYVAGYIRKKESKVRSPDHYLRVDEDTGEVVELEQEFARMSLRPAVGRRWIERWWRDVYPRDYVVIDGVKQKPPRYYDKWMDREFPLIMEEVRQTRYDEAVELSKYTLQAKKKIHESRTSLYEQRDKI